MASETRLLVEEPPKAETEEARIALFSSEGSGAVGVGLGFSRLSNVDVINGTFDSRFILLLWYVEPLLRDRPPTKKSFGWEWQEDCPGCPQLSTSSFPNAKGVLEIELSQACLNDDTQGIRGIRMPGLVRIDHWVSGTFFQDFSLQRFPYDSHILSIHLRSVLAGKSMELVPVREWVNLKHEPQLVDFDIYDPPCASLSYEEEHECGRHRVIISIAIQRKAFAHEINIIGILFLLNMISFTSFLMESLADQMSVSLTLLLTAVAFKFVIADKLPPVSYLTTMDVYLLSVFCFLGLVILANVTASMLPGRQHAIVGFVLALWTTFHVIFTLRVQYLRRPLMHAYFDGQVLNLTRVHSDAERTHRIKLE
ncbi:unnamed protein product [Polarella glacialis]|uniref:Neurotransmitter-gated ion-channel transmembrane domain-containing protein n=1 Tax=Polarella glacialis TaxID=89957 RepID=A0A813JKF4_POLGL|nr:unnamed protein product [Polarella glacialis]